MDGKMVWEMERSYDLSPHVISYCVRGPNYYWILYNPCIQGLV
jgi:hypothetical protein